VTYLARFARKVTLLTRGESLEENMSDYLIQEIGRLPGVEVRLQTEAIDGNGRTRLEEITVRNRSTNRRETLPVSSLFVMIGALPNTQWLSGCVQRDAEGFIVTGSDVSRKSVRLPMRFETSIPGVFAAGDARRASIKRVASAVGEGSVAIHFIHDYLNDPVSV
jgi:thioredoxin reductase (NADPH)